MTEPGVDVNQPEDTRGEGVASLEDRTSPGGQGSPDTNQGKAEPTIPPTPGHADPTAGAGAPSLDEMNVGAADPQAPSHPAAADRPEATVAPRSSYGSEGVAPAETRPVTDAATTGRDLGPLTPDSQGSGLAQRAPGSLGEQPTGEQVETDAESSVAEVAVGGGPSSLPTPDGRTAETGGVDLPGAAAAPGTVEDAPTVRGARTPQD